MVSKTTIKKKIVCVVGLGYVGIPLVNAFSKYVRVIGYDIDKKKINQLHKKYPSLELTSNPIKIKKADIIIITVPTPVTKSKEPNLHPVISASENIGRNLKKHAIVVLESTVYPGTTEEIVGPIIERESNMKAGKDFYLGYSPERVNPGDSQHTISKIIKIVSGEDEETTKTLTLLYSLITTVYKTKNIKTAEAAKVIENIQRDLNIALMNEFSIIFNKMKLDTKEILDAASTKWNFIPFSPGLVGGHCIPVDPYYLVYKAQELGYHSQVILAGRAVNDSIAKYVAEMAIKGINESGKVIKNAKVLVMGLTYKENVPDTRESPVKEIVKELQEYSCDVYGYDPLLNKEKIENFGAKYIANLKQKFDCVIITVAHKQFKQISIANIKAFMSNNPVLIDVRRIYNKVEAIKYGFNYKTL